MLVRRDGSVDGEAAKRAALDAWKSARHGDEAAQRVGMDDVHWILVKSAIERSPKFGSWHVGAML